MDDNNIEYSPPQSPKKNRRRSSFFERRQSVIMTPLPIDESTTIETDENEARHIRMQQYMEKLNNEVKAWKNYYAEKKVEYNGVREKVKSKSNVIPTIKDLQAMLRPEDSEFLEGKPDLCEVWSECVSACTMSRDLVHLATRLASVGDRYHQHFTTQTFDASFR